jgi:hypothetical protein
MRRVAFGLAVLAVLVFAGIAGATSLVWSGQTWTNPYGGIAVNGAGQLAVTSSTCFDTACWGAAHYNTSAAFRSTPGTVVTFSFVDDGPGTAGGQLWIEQESGANPGWSQFGAWQRFSDYELYWWDEDGGSDLLVPTGIGRTAGVHTLALGKRADGTVDYYLDGQLVYTTTALHLDYIGDVYLAANSQPDNPGQTVLYTEYGEVTGYTGPPASKDACKNGGWAASVFPTFKNQGDCVSYVATGYRH